MRLSILVLFVLANLSLFAQKSINSDTVYYEFYATEAYDTVTTNIANPCFIILDVRTPSEFNSNHIARAINMDYYSASFSDNLDTLDKSKKYMLHCASGGRSSQVYPIMQARNFKTVYHMLGGINGWNTAGLPVTTAIVNDTLFANISVAQAYDTIELYKPIPCFKIIDVRTANEFATSHIKNAINIDFYSPTFQQDIDTLDKSSKYLIHCAAGSRSAQAFTLMQGMQFKYVYNMLGGINGWINAGYPVETATGLPDSKTETVAMYPNPARDRITVSSTSKIKRIELFTATGQRVLVKEASDKEVTLRLDDIRQGLYLVRTTTEKQSYTRSVQIL